MRNPFKKVFCEDCEHILLAKSYSDPHLEGSKCKAQPRITNNHISKEPNIDYWFCSGRVMPFCFKFKDK